MASRQLPHNLDAERAVLGALLVAPEHLSEAVDTLTPGDFYRDAHGVIFNRIRHLSERSTAIDFVTLKDGLVAAGELDDVGGPAYIAELADGLPRATNLAYYVGIVREKALRRRLILASRRVERDAYDGDLTVEALIEQTETGILAVGQELVGADFITASDWVRDTITHIETLANDRREVTGISTGFKDLDRMTRGWQPGDLVIVGARPAMGKTSWMLQVALHAAATSPVGIFSVEMATRALGMRAFSVTGHINGMRLLTGRLRSEDYARIAASMEYLAGLKLAIDDSPIVTLMQIRAKARRLKARHGLSLLLIDYLQILEPPGGKRRAENRTIELAQMSRGLKQLAKELQIPVIVLSQLSRQVESREDKRPRLADLRESGAIEQDADVVLLLHRPEYYQATPRDEDIGKAEVIIAKHRNGPTGTVHLRFSREMMRFDDLELRSAS